jgi:hypothetical protein
VHQTEVHAKLISIMGDRVTAHIEILKACIFSYIVAQLMTWETYFVLVAHCHDVMLACFCYLILDTY